MSNNIEIKNQDGIEFLKTLKDNSVDLILTDPPYIISRDSGMEKFVGEVKKIEESGKNKKTLKEWEEYKKKKNLLDDKYKDNYIKYGNASGKKYATKTKFGEWDENFTLGKLKEFVDLFYKKLRKGGTCIIFFDLWKIETLRKCMEEIKKGKKHWSGFKQIRFIEWVKTNPMPRNSKLNYLTNSREVAVLGVKGGKPTFNSQYDKGLYDYPIENGKHRFHETQKSLPLFEELIKKHSNENDLVVDTFLGGGTTAIAAKNTNRRFMGCEIDKGYYDKIIKLLQ